MKFAARTSTRWAALAAVPLGVVLVAGCGSDHSGTTAKDPATTVSTTSTGAMLPACGDVWKAGQTIPDPYKGCVDGDKVVPAHPRHCESGQLLVTYGGTFYGAVGRQVNVVPGGLRTSSNYRSAARACQ